MRQTKVSCNSQLYSEHQTVYTLRVKKSHPSKVCNHKDKTHVGETCFSTEAYKRQFKLLILREANVYMYVKSCKCGHSITSKNESKKEQY